MIHTPFVYLFKTGSSNYAYDVNSNDIVVLNDVTYDMCLLLQSGLSVDDVRRTLSDGYPLPEIDRAFEGIAKLQEEQRLFLDNKPKKIEYLPCIHAYQNRFENYIEQLTLEVTTRCNFRCKYCTYSGIYPHERSHSSTDMSWETAQKALDYIIKHGGHAQNPYHKKLEPDRNFAVGFYGGEPLLKFDLIRQCVKYVREKLGEERICNFTITTNGSLITDEIIQYLQSNEISLCISIDGPESQHNRGRVYSDGRGTYQDVIKSVNRIRSYLDDLKPLKPFYMMVNVVVTGNQDYVDLWNHFVDMETTFNSKYLTTTIMMQTVSRGIDQWNAAYPDDPISAPTGWDRLKKEYEKSCMDGTFKTKSPVSWKMRVLADLVMRSFYLNIYGRTRYQSEGTYVTPERFHPGSICLPGCRRPFVRTNGMILPCERVPSNDPYFVIGNVDEGIVVEESVRLLNDFTDASKEDCKQCWIQKMCSAGCIRDIVVNGEVKPERKLMMCKSARVRTAMDMVDMCELLERQPDALSHYDDITVS